MDRRQLDLPEKLPLEQGGGDIRVGVSLHPAGGRNLTGEHIASGGLEVESQTLIEVELDATGTHGAQDLNLPVG